MKRMLIALSLALVAPMVLAPSASAAANKRSRAAKKASHTISIPRILPNGLSSLSATGAMIH